MRTCGVQDFGKVDLAWQGCAQLPSWAVSILACSIGDGSLVVSTTPACTAVLSEMAQTEQQTLIRVLKDRQITLDDGVSKAFNDNATNHELTSWVQEYLQPETLLTRDELNL